MAAGLYVEHFDMAERHAAVKGGEMGWILETNKAMNRGMEAMGGEIVKRYRVYEQRRSDPLARVATRRSHSPSLAVRVATLILAGVPEPHALPDPEHAEAEVRPAARAGRAAGRSSGPARCPLPAAIAAATGGFLARRGHASCW